MNRFFRQSFRERQTWAAFLVAFITLLTAGSGPARALDLTGFTGTVRFECVAFEGITSGLTMEGSATKGYNVGYRKGKTAKCSWKVMPWSDGTVWVYRELTNQNYYLSYYCDEEEAAVLSLSTDYGDDWFFIHKGHNRYAIKSAYGDKYLSVAHNDDDTYTPSLIDADGENLTDNQLFYIYDYDTNKKMEEDLLACIELTVNGNKAVYDKYGKRLLATVAEDCIEGVNARVTLGCKGGTIDGVPVGEETVQRLRNGAFTLDVLIDEGGMVSAKVVVTTMPVVEVDADYIGYKYYKYYTTEISVHEAGKPDTTYLCKSKYRGATAANYDKKSLGIKLRTVDEYGQEAGKCNASFMGMREDNKWILDAAAIDPSRMRNRVSTDLWNDFSAKPHYIGKEPKMLNGTRGHFVELVLNGSYNGIYCMTEKIDRKQLHLKKYIEPEDSLDCDNRVRGTLYKSIDWNYLTFMGHATDGSWNPDYSIDDYDNTETYWGTSVYYGGAWEHTYPDAEDGQALEWKPLHDAVRFVSAGDEATFGERIGAYFDMPVMRDYYLFIELMLATDNHGKNWFLSCRNTQKPESGDTCRLLITPWDLDGTWGRRWNGGTTWGSGIYTASPTNDFALFLRTNEHGEHGIFHYMNKYDKTTHWTDSLKKRYAELRGGAFGAESLKGRFLHYAELYNRNLAYEREYDRWGAYSYRAPVTVTDIDYEMDYICDWIDRRLAFLDAKYGYDPEAEDGINEAAGRLWSSAMGGNGSIFVNSNSPRTVAVHGMDGKLMRREQVGEGITELRGFTPGIYIVDGRKVVVR